MNLKKRIAVFLCILLTLPTLLQSIPGLTLEANAANMVTHIGSALPSATYSTVGNDYNSTATSRLTLEVGQELDMSTFCSYTSYGGSTYVSKDFYEVKDESYSSSKKSVASVSKNGLITAKKEGEAVITLKYKKLKIKLNIEVVGKNYTNNKKLTALNKRIDTLWKKYGTKKITSKNVISIYNEIISIDKAADKVTKNLKLAKNSYFTTTSTVAENYFILKDGTYRIFTNYRYLTSLSGKINNCLLNKKNSILATVSTKNLTAKSVTATSKKVTVTFNKKITAVQLLSAGDDFSAVINNSKGRKIYYDVYTGNGVNAFNFAQKGTKVTGGSVNIKPGDKSTTVKLKKTLAPGNYYIVFYYKYNNKYNWPALSISTDFTVK